MTKNKLASSLAISLLSISLLNSSIAYSENIDVSSRASVQSGYTSTMVSGINYTGYTEVTKVGTIVGATTNVTTSKLVSPGGIGAHAALYREGTGTAVASTSWGYNSSSTKSFYKTATYRGAKSGQNFRAQGTMKSYNQSTGTYVGTSLKTSPYLTYKSMNLTISDRELQERIRMYESKQMIAAEGLNGKIGYISIVDMGLTENPSTPEEAIALQEERIRKYGEYHDINLYDNDGETVIDKFRIYNI